MSSEASTDSNVEATVRNLLAAAGMSLPDDKVEMYVRIYPRLRAAADALFDIPEVRYQQPAVIYPASI
jgi:hypothetical protein